MSDGKGKYPVNGLDLTHYLPVPMACTFGEKEKNAIKEFREKCGDKVKPGHSDWYLARFLIARKWDMGKATELFINAMKWREEEKIDELVDTFPNDYWYDFLKSYWPTSIGPDRQFWTKDGCPIMYERIGLVSPKIVDYIPLRTLFLWHVYCIELMERQNEKVIEANNFSPGNILNEDLGALAAGHLTKMTTLISTISASDEQRYPESIRKIYIVNPPGVFSMAMGLLKPFMDERTIQKFANGGNSDFNKEWKEVVGEENLPKYLGGTLDWDPPSGGNVKKLMAAKGIKPEKLTIPRRGETSIEVKAKKDQTVWVQVMMKRSDIGVAIYLKGSGDKKEAVLPLKKYDSEKAPHLLSVVAKEDGEYIVHFDNTDSPMMGRNVKILSWVKDPFTIPKKETKEKKHKSHHHHKHEKESKEEHDTKSPRKKKEKGGDSKKDKKEKKKIEVVA